MRTESDEIAALSIIAAELRELGQNVTADDLARRLPDELIVGDAMARRCIPVWKARELIEDAASRKHATAERARKIQRANKEVAAAAQRKHPVPRGGVKLDVPDGLTPAAVMVAADGPAIYEGTYTPRPSAADWLFNSAGDTGGTIGPDPRRRGRKGGAV